MLKWNPYGSPKALLFGQQGLQPFQKGRFTYAFYGSCILEPNLRSQMSHKLEDRREHKDRRKLQRP